MRRKASFVVAGLLVFFFMALAAPGPARAQSANPSAVAMLATLERSGYNYNKVSEGLWELPFTGQNLKNFNVRILVTEDLAVIFVKLADRRDLQMGAPELLKLMELNDQFDTVKLALSKDMLYMRIDVHARLVDEQELKYLVQQMADAVDETYPAVEPYIVRKE